MHGGAHVRQVEQAATGAQLLHQVVEGEAQDVAQLPWRQMSPPTDEHRGRAAAKTARIRWLLMRQQGKQLDGKRSPWPPTGMQCRSQQGDIQASHGRGGQVRNHDGHHQLKGLKLPHLPLAHHAAWPARRSTPAPGFGYRWRASLTTPRFPATAPAPPALKNPCRGAGPPVWRWAGRSAPDPAR